MDMRKSVAAIALLLVASLGGGASAAPITNSRAEVTIFVGGGTPLTNGIFFPGTMLYDGQTYNGVPYEVAKGSDLNLVNLDEATVANGHRLVSLKLNKRTKLPLFQSKLLTAPGAMSKVLTSHLKTGTYLYYCSTHDGMFGAILIK